MEVGILNRTLADLSAGDRTIEDGSQFDKYFEEPKHEKVLLKRDGEVTDTIGFMKKMVNKFHPQCRKIAKVLAKYDKHGKIDELATANNVWNFIVKYIHYNLEEGEQLRTPNQVWWDGQVLYRKDHLTPTNSADCDCMSLFCGCIFKCLGIKFGYRITGYGINGLLGNYQHVYTIVYPKNGQQIICDPVFTKFNSEKSYQIKRDFPMSLNGCDIYMLCGLQGNSGTIADNGQHIYEEMPDGSLGEITGLGGKAKRAEKKQQKAQKKADKKQSKAEKKQEKKLKKAEKKQERKEKKAEKKAEKVLKKAEKKASKTSGEKAEKILQKAQEKADTIKENAKIKAEDKIEKIKDKTESKINKVTGKAQKKIDRNEIKKLKANGASSEEIDAAKQKLADDKKAYKEQKKEDGRGLFRKTGQAIKKGTMLPVRGAFLVLLRMNFRGLASRLSESDEAFDKFAKKWRKIFGGKTAKLRIAVNKGKLHKALFGRKKSSTTTTSTTAGIYGYASKGLGEAATMSAGAAMALASSALTACVGVLKACGVNVPESVEDAIAAGQDCAELLDNTTLSEDPDNYEDGSDNDELIDDSSDETETATSSQTSSNTSTMSKSEKKAAKKAARQQKKAEKKQQKAEKKQQKQQQKAENKASGNTLVNKAVNTATNVANKTKQVINTGKSLISANSTSETANDTNDMVNNTNMDNTIDNSNVKPASDDENFFKKHKTECFVAGGVLVAGILLWTFRDKIFGSSVKGCGYLEPIDLS